MQVSLIDYTGHRVWFMNAWCKMAGMSMEELYAISKLMLVKNTRLFDPDASVGHMAKRILIKHFGQDNYEMPDDISEEDQMNGQASLRAEIESIAATIPSCWEFLDYTFLITGVSRAFTHQLVRTRVASFAQETMRVKSKTNFGYVTPDFSYARDSERANEHYRSAMTMLQSYYNAILDTGARAEDARGVLPTNIKTNILCKFNLRTLAETYRARMSGRVQGEYRQFMEDVAEELFRVHPFTRVFLNDDAPSAVRDLNQKLEEMGASHEDKAHVFKQIDRINRGTAWRMPNEMEGE